jgi:anthranilate phosphoribosyltransferase
MFAPKHHSAMKHAIGPRREMGVRTIFNVLGPLTNPAGAPHQVLGVYSSEWLEPLAQVLGRLGSKHVLVVHAEDGMDEISIGAPTQVAEWHSGSLKRYAITPEQFGMVRADVRRLAVELPAQSLGILREVLDDRDGPARDIVLLNAGAAIYAADLAATLEEGVQKAREAITSGAARERLARLIQVSNGFKAA